MKSSNPFVFSITYVFYGLIYAFEYPKNSVFFRDTIALV